MGVREFDTANNAPAGGAIEPEMDRAAISLDEGYSLIEHLSV